MALQGALAESVREGKELACGRTAVTESVEITTDFANIDAVSVTQEIGTAPGVASSVYTYAVSDNVVTIYAWKVTSSSNPTLIAGTAETDISYIIIGRRR